MDPGLGALCVIRWDLRVLRREGVYFMCGKCMNTGYFYISCSVMSDSVTPWTVAHQVPLSMRFSRQEYWSGLPCPSPGGLPDPGIEPGFPTLQADSLLPKPPGKFFFFFSNNGLQWIRPLRIQTLVNSPPHWLWDWMYDFWPMGCQANIVPVMEGHVEITA